MELRHLRYFIALAEELSFSRAAARVHITQPPLSRAISSLEAEVGTRLFERTTQSVVLTEAGRTFLEHARVALQNATTAVEMARRTGKGEAGCLKVGFVGAAAYSFLPQVLRNYREESPLVDLTLLSLPVTRQLEALAAGEIDVGLVRPPVRESRIATARLLRERFVVALPNPHALVRAPRVSLRDLAGDPFIMFPREEGLGFYNEVMALCRRAGFVPKVAQEATTMHVVIGLVGAGLGIAVVPASATKLRFPRVTYRHLDDVFAITSYSIAWRAGDTSLTVRRFVDIARRSTAAPILRAA